MHNRLIGITRITHVIIEIPVLSLVENGIIFLNNHLWPNFKMGTLHFVDASEETNVMEENAILRNNKHALNFGVTLFKGKN